MKQALSISKKSFLTSRKLILFTALFTVLLYGITLRNGYNIDDELVTIKHRLTSKGIAGIPKIFTSPYYEDEMGYSYEYRPVTLVSFAIEHQFFGDSPKASHFFNLLFYFFCCLAFVFTIRELFTGLNEVFVIIAGSLFIAHPLHSEVVSSIKNRDEILSLLFALLALYQGILFFKKNGLWRVLLVALFLISGLLSKTSSASFILIIPLAGVLIPEADLKKTGILLIAVFIALLVFIILKEYPFRWVLYLMAAITGMLAFVEFFRNKELRGKIINGIKSYGFPDENVLTKISFSEIKLSDWIIYLFVFALCGLAYFKNNFLLLMPALIYLLLSIYWTKKYRFDYFILVSLILCYSVIFHDTVSSLLFFLIYIVAAKERLKNHSVLLLIILGVITLVCFLKSYTLHNFSELNRIWLLGIFLVLSRFIKWRYFHLLYWTIIILPHITGINSDRNHIDPQDFYRFGFLLLAAFATSGISERAMNRVMLSAAILTIVSFFIIVKFSNEPFFTFNNSVKINSTELINRNVPVAAVPQGDIVDKEKEKQEFAVRRKEDRPLDFAEFPLGFSPTLSQKTGTASIIMGRYLKMMFYPFQMSFYYGFSEIMVSEVTEFWSVISILLHLLILASGVYYMRSHQVYFLGVVMYLSSIFLFSNLVAPVAGMLGDRLTFVASSGFAIALGFPMAVFFLKADIGKRRILKIVFSLVLLMFSVKTIARNAQWESHLTLYRHDIKKVEKSAHAHNLLATRLMHESTKSKNETEQVNLRREAITHYKTALDIYPEFFNVQYNLARTYSLMNNGEAAIAEYKKTIALDSLFAPPYFQIALIYEAQNQPQKAIEYYEKLLKISPNELQACINLSTVYFKTRDYQKAIEVNLKAIEIAPNMYEPVVNTGKTYFTMGDKRNALIYFEKAYKINPNDKNLVATMAKIYEEFGEHEKAVYYFSKANQMNH